MTDKWRPISEAPPRAFLVGRTDDPFCWPGYYNPALKGWAYFDPNEPNKVELFDPQPTHYRPLPDPPED